MVKALHYHCKDCRFESGIFDIFQHLSFLSRDNTIKGSYDVCYFGSQF